MAVTQHPLQGHPAVQFGIGIPPAGFLVAEAGSGVDQALHRLGCSAVIAPAAAHLGREVVGMGVEVALRAAVGLPLLQGQKPGVDGRMLPPQVVALVVGE